MLVCWYVAGIPFLNIRATDVPDVTINTVCCLRACFNNFIYIGGSLLFYNRSIQQTDFSIGFLNNLRKYCSNRNSFRSIKSVLIVAIFATAQTAVLCTDALVYALEK